MRKLIISALPALMIMLASCMNTGSSSEESGSVRITLPGSARASYSKNSVDKYIVRLLLDNETVAEEEGFLGGVLEFKELEEGTYIAQAEAWNTSENLLEGQGRAKIKVRAGETYDCTIKMILEGFFYSKYIILEDASGNFHKYDYSTLADIGTIQTSYYPAEDINGNFYRIDNESLFKDSDNITGVSSMSSTFSRSPLSYDYTTDTVYLVSEITEGLITYLNLWNLDLQTKNLESKQSSIKRTFGVTEGSSFLNFAIQGSNGYLIYKEYSSNTTASDWNIIHFNPSSAAEIDRITLGGELGLDGELTDIKVLEDGTVAALARHRGIDKSGTFRDFTMGTTIADGETVYSRGTLILLEPDLTIKKIIGWTESPRQINSIGTTADANENTTLIEWNSITAYIPEYEERGSHFYGPERIVAIRPKEIVIADCGANFVFPDYKNKRNGKMYTHNRLMTVNLKTFAVGCLKEFNNSEIKFKDLEISGGIAATSNWNDNGYVSEK